MLIRYLAIKNYPPLLDLKIPFSKETLIESECTIRFAVGVNGSGKSHLLRAIFETFLNLARRVYPEYPVLIVYSLKGNRDSPEANTTYLFERTETRETKWYSTQEKVSNEWQIVDWEEFTEQIQKTGTKLMDDNGWPSESTLERILPRTVLGYTSGRENSWEKFFEFEFLDSTLEQLPKTWDEEIEEHSERIFSEYLQDKQEQQICYFLNERSIKLAFIAFALSVSVPDAVNPELETDFLKTVENSGCDRPLSISWKIDSNSYGSSNKYKTELRGLFLAANSILKEKGDFIANDSDYVQFRILHIDLDATNDSYKKHMKSIFGEDKKPFEFFKKLLLLERQGLIEDIEIALLKSVEEKSQVILFSELSDGEQMFLCRMSLFHLLKDYDDALLILDEPETHFNDKWKREIVDMIDSALKDTASEVLISTHSSIVLTDVFHDEIVLLDKDVEGTKRIELVSPTFGAITSEILTKVFGQGGDQITIGRRAYKYLKKLLTERKWSQENMEELENIVNKIGVGYYQNRLSSILYKLKEEKNASSN